MRHTRLQKLFLILIHGHPSIALIYYLIVSMPAIHKYVVGVTEQLVRPHSETQLDSAMAFMIVSKTGNLKPESRPQQIPFPSLELSCC